MAVQVEQTAIGEQAEWFDEAPKHLSEQLKSWLLDPNSLTARLKQHCQEFNVDVHIEGELPITAAEKEHVEHDDDAFWIREVMLKCDGAPHVYARSVIPAHSLIDDRNQLTELGAKPLGQVLFNDPDMTRTGFHIGLFDLNSQTVQRLQQYGITIKAPIWARRSLFEINKMPILVMEVFLPDAVAYEGDD